MGKQGRVATTAPQVTAAQPMISDDVLHQSESNAYGRLTREFCSPTIELVNGGTAVINVNIPPGTRKIIYETSAAMEFTGDGFDYKIGNGLYFDGAIVVTGVGSAVQNYVLIDGTVIIDASPGVLVPGDRPPQHRQITVTNNSGAAGYVSIWFVP